MSHNPLPTQRDLPFTHVYLCWLRLEKKTVSFASGSLTRSFYSGRHKKVFTIQLRSLSLSVIRASAKRGWAGGWHITNLGNTPQLTARNFGRSNNLVIRAKMVPSVKPYYGI